MPKGSGVTSGRYVKPATQILLHITILPLFHFKTMTTLLHHPLLRSRTFSSSYMHTYIHISTVHRAQQPLRLAHPHISQRGPHHASFLRTIRLPLGTSRTPTLPTRRAQRAQPRVPRAPRGAARFVLDADESEWRVLCAVRRGRGADECGGCGEGLGGGAAGCGRACGGMCEGGLLSGGGP